ncbi:MAG: SPOR domain-containing protein [Flavobacteriaceae bacterium]|nr:SPOR domain-containing protein [Flavobacteriaceae bacterium]
MKLDKHIRDLLYRNECVVIPDFGAFITSTNSAKIKNSIEFIPPSKSITFNYKIQKNDGLLSSYIADSNNLSFDDAMKIIKLNVINFKQILEKNKKIDFEDIGQISLNHGIYQFNSNPKSNYLKESYGLTNITNPVIQRKSNSSIPKLFKYAAILLIGFLISNVVYNNEVTKINQKNLVTYEKASMLIEEKIQKATFVIENPLPLIKMIVKEEVGSFHVVAGSFSIEENSYKRLNELKSLGYNSRKIGVNKYGLFQVAYASFNTRLEADSALLKIRKDDNVAAWILNKELN